MMSLDKLNPSRTFLSNRLFRDDANFINFCSGNTLTNGKQIVDGSCNGIPMGEIPAKGDMVSTIIISPKHNDNIKTKKDFDVVIAVINLSTGQFTNPDTTYYSAPQQLDKNGKILGHTHVVIQVGEIFGVSDCRISGSLSTHPIPLIQRGSHSSKASTMQPT